MKAPKIYSYKQYRDALHALNEGHTVFRKLVTEENYTESEPLRHRINALFASVRQYEKLNGLNESLEKTGK